MEPSQAETAPPRARGGGLLRGRLPLVLGIVAGVALCVAALAIGSVLAPQPPDPAPTARALCADLVARDYAAAYALLSPQQQAAGTPAQFEASQRELDSLRGPTKHCEFTIASEGDGVAVAALTITRGTSAPAVVNVRLLLAASGWRVDSFNSSLVRAATGTPGASGSLS